MFTKGVAIPGGEISLRESAPRPWAVVKSKALKSGFPQEL